MCGIAGFLFSSSLGADAAQRIVTAMTDAIAHRGPDDAAHFIDDATGIALGHRRLAIIDLSPAGRQPMQSVCGRYTLVYNGEIYNHRDLRAELEAAGAAPAWRGHSDTEVLLAAIVHWGFEAALQRANGMFALALWDKMAQRLFLARDRLGEKPLYYGWTKSGFIFGSELKALMQHPEFQRDLNRDALALYLRHNYIPAPHSVWKNIYKLPPAHFISVVRHETSAPQCFWSFEQAVQRGQAAPRADTPELLADLENLLRDAVLRRMDSDVPMGAFLSGGVDSSIVVALMQAQSARPVRTFSMGFHEKAYNEAEHGKAVAAHLGTEHTELYVTPQDTLDVVPHLPTIWDEPFSDSSQIPTLLLSALTKKYVTVSLSGDAGDELFGGYNRYFQATWLQQKMALLPGVVRRGASCLFRNAAFGSALGALNNLLPQKYRQAAVADRLPKIAGLLEAESDDAMYLHLVSHFSDPASLLQNTREPDTLLRQKPFQNLDFAHRMMAMDTLTYLPDDILVKVDRASMAVSLEGRVPFLDHRLVEFAWQMPLSAKVRGGTGKYLLRQLLYKYVPQEIVNRPKMGFGVPIEAWLRGPLRPWAEELLAPDRLRQEAIFNADKVTTLWTEHKSGKRRWHAQLWTILMFQAWWERVNTPGYAMEFLSTSSTW